MQAITVRTRAKTSVRQVLELPLRDLAGLDGSETFDYQLVVPPAMSKLVGGAPSVNPVATTISSPLELIRLQVS